MFKTCKAVVCKHVESKLRATKLQLRMFAITRLPFSHVVHDYFTFGMPDALSIFPSFDMGCNKHMFHEIIP